MNTSRIAIATGLLALCCSSVQADSGKDPASGVRHEQRSTAAPTGTDGKRTAVVDAKNRKPWKDATVLRADRPAPPMPIPIPGVG